MKKSNAFITSENRTNGGGNFILPTANSDYNQYAYRTDVQPSENEHDTRQPIYTSKFAKGYIPSTHAPTETSFMYMYHFLTCICMQIKSECKYTTYFEF